LLVHFPSTIFLSVLGNRNRGAEEGWDKKIKDKKMTDEQEDAGTARSTALAAGASP
jgi:hypothetical protein